MNCVKTMTIIQTSLSLPTLGSLVAQSTIIQIQKAVVARAIGRTTSKISISGMPIKVHDGGRSRGRTDTFSEERQILSLVRLPIPPFGHGERALTV
jgi:hypothetical protein